MVAEACKATTLLPTRAAAQSSGVAWQHTACLNIALLADLSLYCVLFRACPGGSATGCIACLVMLLCRLLTVALGFLMIWGILCAASVGLS